MSTPFSEMLLHALDLTMMKAWDEAKKLLEPLDSPLAGRLFLLVCELEQQEQSRVRALTVIRHETGNALAIVRANLEGMADGLLPATPDRIESVIASLSSIATLLDDLRRLPEATSGVDRDRSETFNLSELIRAHAAAIVSLARAKNVELTCDAELTGNAQGTHQGDVSRIGRILREVLINAVRYTPPGGTVEIRCDRPGTDVTVRVYDKGASVAEIPHIFEPQTRLLRMLGGDASIESTDPHGATFTVNLPAAPLTHYP